MARMIFVNLPVTDLARSVRFYEAVGATKNPQFSDDSAACMVFSETIFVMLLTHERFRSFTARRIPDSHESAQMLIAMNCDSTAAVDEVVAKAAAAAGTADPNPKQELGFMYSRSYADPDGHIWEAFWMDPAAVAAA